MLVRGSWEALAAPPPEDDDVLVVDEPDQVRRQVCRSASAPRRPRRAGRDGGAPRHGRGAAAVAALLAAGALVLLDVVTIDQAFRAISWTTVVLVGGMIPLSLAMQETGAAEQLANGLTDVVGDSAPTRCWPACSCSPPCSASSSATPPPR